MAWNDGSWVKCCRECEGTGWVPAVRRPTIDDPYPENPCGCGEDSGPICQVCGYRQEHEGYDCLACETVAALVDNEVAEFSVDGFAAALKVALDVRMKDRGK